MCERACVVCFICVHDMFVHIEGIYTCMSYVHLGILQYSTVHIYDVHN